MHGIEFRLEFLIGLLGIVALLAQLARMAGVPYPIFLVLGGIGVGLVPGLPQIELPPEIIFLVFIPPLLLSAALSSSPRDLRAHARPIGLLAVGLVLLTTTAVAAVAHLVIELPWAAAFVLGAVVAPTDPVAAEATFRRLGVPDRVQTIVGGESIINDGTALVAYNIAVAAVVTGLFSVAHAGLEFLLVSGGGIILGAVVARLVTPLYGRLTDPTILVVFTLIPAYFSYILAERLGVSGILAVVTLGLYVGWQAPKLFTARARVQSYSFWAVLTFLMDSLLFILVGLQFPVILENMQEYSIAQLLLYAALVCGVVIGLRLLWFLFAPSSTPALDRLLRTTYLRAPWQERMVMGWSGMRGAISLAAALAVPLQTQAGVDFPQRDLIIFLTYCVIFATLVLQGLSLPFLILSLGVRDEGDDARMAELEARLKATRTALDRLDGMCEDENVPARSRERLREIYEERIRRYESGLEAGRVTDEYQESSTAWSRWRRELFDAERETIVSLRDAGEINADVMRRVERDIDLEELRESG
ncbi:MAG TPA: Na+/H+ antiporter [Rubrobacter sp.]|nr:Na+/H+ antiporter [Rubrobacter sp.]